MSFRASFCCASEVDSNDFARCPKCGRQRPPSGANVVSLPSPNGRIVSTRDFAILENLARLQLPAGHPVGALLRAQLDSCRIVSPENIAPDIVTLNTRAVFSIDGASRESRVLVHTEERSLYGGTISVTTPLGAALLGLRAGTSAPILPASGRPRTLFLEAVAYQPEAEERARAPEATPRQRGAVLTLASARRKQRGLSSPDDPGPGAA